MPSLFDTLLPVVRANLVPDYFLRAGVRSLLNTMVTAQDSKSLSDRVSFKMAYVADLRTRLLAEDTRKANEQHYEVPAAFYQFVMGRNRKYSCGIWPEGGLGVATLDESEEAALALVCERAGITKSTASGTRVLDMGCGWGSFSLFCAAKFPQVLVTGVSNSASQRDYIMGQASERGLMNVNIITADINVFDGAGGNFGELSHTRVTHTFFSGIVFCLPTPHPLPTYLH
jgi:cyclopropane-fatty-acyl-phospholipid synthase